jgi:hypothetical protein
MYGYAPVRNFFSNREIEILFQSSTVPEHSPKASPAVPKRVVGLDAMIEHQIEEFMVSVKKKMHFSRRYPVGLIVFKGPSEAILLHLSRRQGCGSRHPPHHKAAFDNQASQR